MCRDGSVVYANNGTQSKNLRSYKDGNLKLRMDGLLYHKADGIAILGYVRNSWAIFSVLQALFIKEHNIICSMLKPSNLTLLFLKVLFGYCKSHLETFIYFTIHVNYGIG